MKKIILNGLWDFVADLDPKYHSDPRVYSTPPFADPRADRRHWLKVPVPGVWQKYGERYDIFEGVCWFAREFDAGDLEPGVVARLRFAGVNYLCRVFLNGKDIGGHEGGYTEFALDAASALQPGRNHIAVQVDNRAVFTRWPPVLGYFNYGGIHRDVTLEIIDRRGLCDLKLDAQWDGQCGRLAVAGQVLPSGAKRTVRVQCNAKQSVAIVESSGSFRCELNVPCAEPWSPDVPRLHEVRVILDEEGGDGDAMEFRCGFRTLKVSRGQICLNGRPITLKGVCYVYDSPVSGLVMTSEQIAADVALMKELGCNAVRCHYPMDRRFYEACDRAGLLVWIEPPVYCYHPGDKETGTRFADGGWLTLARQTACEMIAVARNHPSVSIYSIGNECNTRNPEADAFFRELAATIRAQDPTRLISYAALYGIVGPVADIVDVLGINSYWGWYDRIWGRHEPAAVADGSIRRTPIDLAPMRKMLDEVLKSRPELGLLLTEFGADSVPGFFSTSRDLWSEEYHADLLSEIFKLAAEYPRIVGRFPFCFSDYRDPSKVHNGYWNELNLKGAVDYRRNRKLAFAAIQRHYSPTNTSLESPHDASDR